MPLLRYWFQVRTAEAFRRRRAIWRGVRVSGWESEGSRFNAGGMAMSGGSHSGIEVGVEEVGDQVGHDDRAAEYQEQTLQGGEVPFVDRGDG